MDGPISTSQAAGRAQKAASFPFRNPSVGPPKKVPPVSEGNRPRSSVRDEAKTQDLPYFVELRPGKPQDSGRGAQTGSSQDAPPSPLESEAYKGGGPLPGDSSTPVPRELLAEALAAAKARRA